MAGQGEATATRAVDAQAPPKKQKAPTDGSAAPSRSTSEQRNGSTPPEPLKLPPHSIEAERALLVGLLRDNNVLGKIAHVVAEADFYTENHQRIFRTIAELIGAEQPADPVTVDDAMKASGHGGALVYLADLLASIPGSAAIQRYAEIVRERAELRAQMTLGADLHDAAAAPGANPAGVRQMLDARLVAVRGRENWPALDLEELAGREAERPQFLIPDWLPVGYATLLAGHGGVGKSAIALHLAVCAAAGASFFGVDVERRRVLYLSCEDRVDVLHWRLARICAFLGVDMASLRDRLVVLDLVGRDCVLWDVHNGTTAAYGRLREQVRQRGTELLMVDGLSDTFAGPPGAENDRGQAKRYMNALVGLIPPQRGAVVVVGHVSKPTASGGATSEGYSGSTGWHNAVRARWYLYPETRQGEDGERAERSGGLLLELQKSNLGRVDQSMRFTWDDDAHLFVGEVIGGSAFDRKHQDRVEQDGIRRAMKAAAESGIAVPAAATGPRTGFHVLRAQSDFPASLTGGRQGTRRFWRHVEELRAMRHIADESIARKSDRHYVRTLALTPDGMRACG